MHLYDLYLILIIVISTWGSVQAHGRHRAVVKRALVRKVSFDDHEQIVKIPKLSIPYYQMGTVDPSIPIIPRDEWHFNGLVDPSFIPPPSNIRKGTKKHTILRANQDKVKSDVSKKTKKTKHGYTSNRS
jgi:hypothetical protein